MQEPQLKRSPGRPRKAIKRVHVDITLSLETIIYLDKQPISRSRFIEQLIETHRDIEQVMEQEYKKPI